VSADASQAQQRRRSMALTPAEANAFLAGARTARVATIASDGWPHVTPLWFLWHDGAVWLYSLVRSRRWNDLTERVHVAVVVDDGEEHTTLRGVEIRGRAQAVGEQPRTGREEVPELVDVERLYAAKYGSDRERMYDGRHAWIRVSADQLRSWDHRKLAVEVREEP
jgi:nitroimidazol reductase NimA-like FMN-containing flavoprotein (pyridoxamine 5'-phosphate oxidase superfamily)